MQQTTDNIKKEYRDYRSFINNQNLIIIAAGVCIGLATKDVVFGILNELVLPAIISLTKTSFMTLLYQQMIRKTHQMTLIHVLKGVGKFVWYILTWFITIIIVFIMFVKLLHVDIVASKLDFLADTGKALFNLS
jgi:large-conductance mechanosensitive channel